MMGKWSDATWASEDWCTSCSRTCHDADTTIRSSRAIGRALGKLAPGASTCHSSPKACMAPRCQLPLIEVAHQDFRAFGPRRLQMSSMARIWSRRRKPDRSRCMPDNPEALASRTPVRRTPPRAAPASAGPAVRHAQSRYPAAPAEHCHATRGSAAVWRHRRPSSRCPARLPAGGRWAAHRSADRLPARQ